MFHFLSYHNAVPIALSIIVLSSSAAFAANSEAVYSEESEVVSVDNTYIANKDLTNYAPRVEILSVTEDADNYFIPYRLTTIDVVDAVWRDVAKEITLTVSKQQLGVRDLGVFATAQLKEVVDAQLAYLREVQENAQKQVTQKTVATTYGGLVGKFLDTTTEELPGYTPVVAALPEVRPVPPALDPNSQAASVSSAVQPTSPPSSSNPLTIQMLGDNPAQHPIGSNPYADLGVITTGGSGTVMLQRYVNDAPVDQVVLDATYLKEWHVRYEATDAAGNSAAVERLVVIVDPNAQPQPPAPPPETPAPEEPVNEPASAEPEVLPQTPPETGTTASPEIGTSTPSEE